MVKFQPEGWRTVTPRIFTDDVRGWVEFLKIVFDATGAYRIGAPAEMKIGDSVVMVSGEDGREAMPAFLYVYSSTFMSRMPTQHTDAQSMPAAGRSRNLRTCPMATDGRWCRIGGGTDGRSRHTADPR
jgi:hypothetical protein